MSLRWIIVLLIFSTTTAFTTSKEKPVKIDVVRDDKPLKQIFIKLWQGESPSPVIDIHSKIPGTTLIEAWSQIENLDQKKDCTIKNGLYHPWSNGRTSAIGYYTLAGVEDYAVIDDLTPEVYRSFFIFEDAVPPIKKGDRIIDNIYIAEGISIGVLVQGELRTLVNFQSRVFKENPFFFSVIEKTPNLVETKDPISNTPYLVPEQWIHLNCEEGYEAFIRDSELLKQSDVLEGSVTGYGDIVPAK